MDSLSVLLTGPGGFIAGLLPFAGAEDSEARADLVVTLGIVFWFALTIGVRLAIHFGFGRQARLGGPGSPGAAGRAAFDGAEAQVRSAARSAGQQLRQSLRGWTWPMAAGAAWRLQVVHLVVYAVLPLLWVGANFSFFVVTFPLRVIGTGNGPGWYDGALDHMKRPTCWTFVTPCAGPRVEPGDNAFRIGGPDCSPGTSCTVPRPTRYDILAWAVFWKSIWLIPCVFWIHGWRRRRAPLRRGPA